MIMIMITDIPMRADNSNTRVDMVMAMGILMEKMTDMDMDTKSKSSEQKICRKQMNLRLNWRKKRARILMCQLRIFIFWGIFF
jgi:hypothetical protein